MRHRDCDIDDERPQTRRGAHRDLKRDNAHEDEDDFTNRHAKEDYPLPERDVSYLARSIRS